MFFQEKQILFVQDAQLVITVLKEQLFQSNVHQVISALLDLVLARILLALLEHTQDLSL